MWKYRMLFAFCLPADVPCIAATNIPPRVRILYPALDQPLAAGHFTKLKSEAFDADGNISEVRFYGSYNGSDMLLGTATNAPFDIVWPSANGGTWNFTAVARDNSGAETRSPRVQTYIFRDPPTPHVLVTPTDGSLVAAGTDLQVGMELVQGQRRAFSTAATLVFDDLTITKDLPPVNATNMPLTITVTNVEEGEHSFRILYEESAAPCHCPPHRISAVNLGLRDAVLTWDNHLAFEIVTAFPGQEVMLESSTNLTDWSTVEAVTPEAHYHHVRLPVDMLASRRWYRVSMADSP